MDEKMSDDCIVGPCEGLSHAGVTDIETYRDAHRKAMGTKGQVEHEDEDQKRAYINHGRWVVDCPTCNGAGLTSRTMKVSCCFDCGSVYTKIRFPRNAKKIEHVLLKRPDVASRNWTTETIKELLKENHDHGVTDGMD
jgi:hypothetical protein